MISNLIKDMEEENKFFASVSCQKCGSDVIKTPHHHPFVPGRLGPASLAKCVRCDMIFDPYTKLIMKDGNMINNIEPSLICTIPEEE